MKFSEILTEFNNTLLVIEFVCLPFWGSLLVPMQNIVNGRGAPDIRFRKRSSPVSGLHFRKMSGPVSGCILEKCPVRYPAAFQKNVRSGIRPHFRKMFGQVSGLHFKNVRSGIRAAFQKNVRSGIRAAFQKNFRSGIRPCFRKMFGPVFGRISEKCPVSGRVF